MRFSSIFSLLSLTLVAAEPLPFNFGGSEPNLQALLLTLSAPTRQSAVLPDDPLWANASIRYSAGVSATPDINLIISPQGPAAEKDVEKIVFFAQLFNIDLHPITSGHGIAVSLSKYVKNGIQINLRPGFTQIKRIDADTIEVGAGVINAELVDYLYENNVRTSTGGCDCVGFHGLALGGGLGKYNGQLGLVTDVVKEVDIVTPTKGRVVANANKNKELFYGLRGFGHNLGIALKTKVKIVPVDPEYDSNEWVNAQYIYSIDKLEEVIEYTEHWRKNIQQPQTTLFIGPAFQFDESGNFVPGLSYSFQYFGPRSKDAEVFAPFDALGPSSNSSQIVPWNGIAKATGIGLDDIACQNNNATSTVQFSAQLSKLVPEGIREFFDYYYNDLVPWTAANTPGGFAIPVWEVYPQQGVREVPAGSTAYAWRHKPITSAILSSFPNEGGPAMEAALEGKAREAVALLNKYEDDWGTYINYARGNEDPEVIYGKGARLVKLKALKMLYDPRGLLNGYSPIV